MRACADLSPAAAWPWGGQGIVCSLQSLSCTASPRGSLSPPCFASPLALGELMRVRCSSSRRLTAGELLRVDMRVLNTDDKPFEFTMALHT